MRRAAVAVVLLAGVCASADAQPGTSPATALEEFPHVAISNDLITAQVYPPGARQQLYRGTRFDHAGVIFHVTYRGQDYSNYWFDRFVIDPMDGGKYPPGTEHACCSVSGPVEEFAPVGFDEAGLGGRFLKLGVGIVKRTNDKYDQFPTLPVLNEGQRSFNVDPSHAQFIQDLSDPESGYGYQYLKTVTLVAGKPQMIISHLLRNTGKKDIVTTVYNHNFLTLSPGNEHMVITAPFTLVAETPLQPELAKLDGNAIRYLQPLKTGETVQSPISGFGPNTTDYDFRIVNSATGYGIRMRADQPLAHINFWSVRTTLGWEPYIAISLKPGESKRWTNTYDFFGPGEDSK